MATLAEMLRQGADRLINLPTEAQRFVTNPQAFTQLLTGKNPLPRETGFAAGATGLPPTEMSVLDPNQAPYMQGYTEGEPIGYAAMAAPFATSAAVATGKTLAPKLGQVTENYMVNQGFMPSVVPPSPTKVADALRQPEKNALGFYSPLDEAVMNLQNQKGTGQQYLAQLLKTQGVKQEELATRGLDTFLTQNPKVTKTQIEDFLGQNPVNIRETVLGVPEKFDADRLKQLEKEYAGLKQHAIDDPRFGELKYDEMIRLQNIRDNSTLESLYARAEADERTAQRMQQLGLKDEAEKYFKQAELLNTRAEKLDLEELGPALPTKFSDYTLPAGENYREVLIQYPNEAKPAVFPKQAELDAVNEQLAQLKKAGNREEYGQLIGTRTALNNERKAFMKQADYEAGNRKEFLSSHFDQPNILAHMRVTDRNIDGKKTLFVEEIQSDWHQAGRKKGYATPETKRLTGTVEEQTSEYGFKPEYKVNWEDGTFSGGYGSREAAEARAAEGKSNAKTGVPDAPFKKNWQELAMKRAMQMAAEGGYDRVAFTTGKQQADRFSLSKQINDLTITRTPTEFKISATDLNGKPAILKSIPDLRDLDEFVGKDLANKIKDDFANKSGQEHNYSGLDLEVGGEGMKGFYDKILPDFVNKYGKKHGLKVGQADLPINAQDQIDIIKANAGRTYGVGSDAYNQALKNQYESVHYFDLTPEAKTSFLSKGQPMFAAAPIVATDEETRREMLEKLFNSQK